MFASSVPIQLNLICITDVMIEPCKGSVETAAEDQDWDGEGFKSEDMLQSKGFSGEHCDDNG